MTAVCLMQGLSACTLTPYARLTLEPSGNVVGLSRPCLDIWFDGADEESWLEPSAVTFLAAGVAA